MQDRKTNNKKKVIQYVIIYSTPLRCRAIDKFKLGLIFATLAIIRFGCYKITCTNVMADAWEHGDVATIQIFGDKPKNEHTRNVSNNPSLHRKTVCPQPQQVR